MMCYACRRDIDSLSSRCPYCTSEVEAYSGNRPTVYSRSDPVGPVGEPYSPIPGLIVIMAAISGFAWMCQSWWMFGIPTFFVVLCFAMSDN